MSDKTIGAAIIGYGYMGRIRRRVIEADPAYRLVGVAEVPERRPAGETSVRWFDRWQDLVADKSVGAVFVCVPNNLIPDITVACLEQGRHVFCEKPPGRTVDDIQAMRAAEAASGRKLMFGFNHRWHPAMQEARRIIDSGAVGRVLWVKGTYGKSGGQGYEKSWRNDPAVSGGGILLDQGIHMVDLFRFYCGDFDRVKAFCGHSYWKVPVEDNAFVVFENDRGQHGILHSSATLWKHVLKLEIGAEDGYLVIEGFLSASGSYGRETLTVGKRQFGGETRAQGNPEEQRFAYDRDDSWALEVANFARAITTGSKIEQCGSHDALRAMELIFAAYRDSGLVD
ncbi:MAG: Gfo/Idh/MocA family oxidoreductase [Planctomycetes bacterium]|nr:Gfo/Idh/MocA family oxidoreductase [Planctomycetota bacterium]